MGHLVAMVSLQIAKPGDTVQQISIGMLFFAGCNPDCIPLRDFDLRCLASRILHGRTKTYPKGDAGRDKYMPCITHRILLQKFPCSFPLSLYIPYVYRYTHAL